ncbi:MAG: hypothetical protein KGH64_04260 [Candidatus Micrarchaeota archaeon]|nr:hypothetical protein [Candidatus Micrarchaeota archaeon]
MTTTKPTLRKNYKEDLLTEWQRRFNNKEQFTDKQRAAFDKLTISDLAVIGNILESAYEQGVYDYRTGVL